MIIRQVMGITDEPHQRHEILYQGAKIDLELRYLPAVEIWVMDVVCPLGVVNGVKLTDGADLLYGYNYPYTFAVTTTEGIEPFTLGCFSTNRSKLFFIDKGDGDD